MTTTGGDICQTCGGLIMVPNVAYGWAGPVCYCCRPVHFVPNRLANTISHISDYFPEDKSPAPRPRCSPNPQLQE